VLHRRSSFLVLVLAAGLLALAVSNYVDHTGRVEGLFSTLFMGLAFAIFLNILAFWNFNTERREIDRAFKNTDCESYSIFENALDGILILDNEGECLDANPAAALILRMPVNRLISRNIGQFLMNTGDSVVESTLPFWRGCRRGCIGLIAGNGAQVSVDFAVTTNYLPGRHVLILCDVTERARGEIALRESEARFRYMADNIQEIFWMMDAQTGEIRYANSAYETLTGHTVESLYDSPSSYRELIHPDDRTRVLTKIENLTEPQTLDEEFRFIPTDGHVHWAWAKGVAVSEGSDKHWIVGTVQDVTARKHAEFKVEQQLQAVKAARAEAEALRKATLALSQNLTMDSVLDTLLQCIRDLIPFDRAAVFFLEEGPDFMLAREAPRVPERIGLTVASSESSLLQRLLFEKQAVLLTHTIEHPEWRDVVPFERIQSWMGVPLIARGIVLGVLSLGTNTPLAFSPEHLRLAKSFAVPAAVAIQNARTHERAEIYASELELRLEQLRNAQNALQQVAEKPQ
jgi:PAS domain S-box-containing protein